MFNYCEASETQIIRFKTLFKISTDCKAVTRSERNAMPNNNYFVLDKQLKTF